MFISRNPHDHYTSHQVSAMLSLIWFIRLLSMATAGQIHSPALEAARAMCEGLSASPNILLSKLAANRCMVKPNFTSVYWENAVCDPIAGLRRGRLAFPYSRPVSKVITGPMSTTFAGPMQRSWLALYQADELDEPAGNWALKHHDGTPLFIPNEAIAWSATQPNDINDGGGTLNNPTCERAEFIHSGGGDYYYFTDVHNLGFFGIYAFDYICEYELDNNVPGQFELIGKDIGLAQVLVIQELVASSPIECASRCWNAYICGSFSYNHVTNQCQLYWIHSQHPNFVANKITMPNTLFYDVM